jgi:DNA oxidative demethylase
MPQRSLFEPETRTETIPGFRLRPDLLSTREESALLTELEALPFRDFRMHGVVAKRKVVHFGWDYGYESWRIERTTPIPEWLLPLRRSCAALAALEAGSLAQVLIARYPPGAGIGWHRDAPMFGPTVVGVSLLGACEMRFRRMKRAPRERSIAVPLAARAAYVLGGEARSAWQHSIPPVSETRYSITFRTVRRGAAGDNLTA